MKRGYIGFLESCYLLGRSKGVNNFLTEKGIILSDSNIPLHKMIYLAAFQGGIQTFVKNIDPEEKGPIDEFLSKRVSPPKSIDPKIFITLFNACAPNGVDKMEKEAIMTVGFIFDLLCAMQNDASIINVSGIPSIERTQKCLPPEISSPICQILSQLSKSEEHLPAPSLSVSRGEVSRFKEILESDIYNRYSCAHKEIEISKADAGANYSNIRNTGSKLMSSAKDVLIEKNVSINLLPILPKVVDAAFGKLPGILAEFAGDMALRFIEDKRNIVIYQFDEWASNYRSSYLHHAFRENVDN